MHVPVDVQASLQNRFVDEVSKYVAQEVDDASYVGGVDDRGLGLLSCSRENYEVISLGVRYNLSFAWWSFWFKATIVDLCDDSAPGREMQSAIRGMKMDPLSRWLCSKEFRIRTVTWDVSSYEETPEVIKDIIPRVDLDGDRVLEFPDGINFSVKDSVEFAAPWMKKKIESMGPALACQAALLAGAR